MSAVANMLNASVREYIPTRNQKLIKTWSQNTAYWSKLYRKHKKFNGGVDIQNLGNIRDTINYRPLPGGPHVKGGTFVNTSTDFAQPIYFSLKYLEVTVVVNKIDVMVINRSGGSDEVIFSILDETLSNGMDSLGKYAEIGAYLPGQGASYTAGFNGLTEICNDGTKTPAIGSATTTYGGLSRANTDYGYAVQGKTYNVNGALTFRYLLDTLNDVTVDNMGPDFGLTTPKVSTFIEDRFQPQQRFSGTTDTDIGMPGWKFHNQTVFLTRYAPGSWISAASATSGENRIAYEYIRRLSTQSGSPLTAYPTVTGETWYWCATRDPYTQMYVSASPLFNFGFDDFQGDRDDDDLAGRFRLAACFYSKDNRRQAELNQILV